MSRLSRYETIYRIPILFHQPALTHAQFFFCYPKMQHVFHLYLHHHIIVFSTCYFHLCHFTHFFIFVFFTLTFFCFYQPDRKVTLKQFFFFFFFTFLVLILVPSYCKVHVFEIPPPQIHFTRSSLSANL